MSDTIQTELTALKERNQRVELDKAWETSWTRRLFISFVTYIVACVWLLIIKNPNPFLNSIVPVAGYLLSTLSLPMVRKWWERR